jgi:hypothetical protein
VADDILKQVQTRAAEFGEKIGTLLSNVSAATMRDWRRVG